jgi:nucleoside permease NupC
MLGRIAAGVVLALLVLFAPWPLFVVAACAFLLWFPRYDEAIVAAFVFDLLYRPETAMFSFEWSMTAVIVATSFMIEILRTRMRILRTT